MLIKLQKEGKLLEELQLNINELPNTKPCKYQPTTLGWTLSNLDDFIEYSKDPTHPVASFATSPKGELRKEEFREIAWLLIEFGSPLPPKPVDVCKSEPGNSASILIKAATQRRQQYAKKKYNLSLTWLSDISKESSDTTNPDKYQEDKTKTFLMGFHIWKKLPKDLKDLICEFAATSNKVESKLK